MVLLGLIEVKKISMSTTLALCTLIHAVGLVMYLKFDRLNKQTSMAAVPYAALVESGSSKKMIAMVPDVGSGKKDKVAPFA